MINIGDYVTRISHNNDMIFKVIDIINDSKKESEKRSIELYGKAVEQALADYQLHNPKDKDIVEEYKTTNTPSISFEEAK